MEKAGYLERCAATLIQYFAVSWGWSFYITWLPTYVRQERAASIEQSAWLSALPLFLGGFGCLAGGAAIPLLTRVTGNRAAARATIAAVGCVFSRLVSCGVSACPWSIWSACDYRYGEFFQ